MNRHEKQFLKNLIDAFDFGDTEEEKNKMYEYLSSESELCLNKTEKIPAVNRGVPNTKTHNEAIANALRGKQKTTEHKNALRVKKSYVPPRSEEHKRKIGLSKIGKQRITFLCEHCNKEIAAGNFTRWHGDNCKELKR